MSAHDAGHDDCVLCLRELLRKAEAEIERLNSELRLRDRVVLDVLRRAGTAQADMGDRFTHWVRNNIGDFSACYCSRLTPTDVLKTRGCIHWYYDPVTKTNQPNRRRGERRDGLEWHGCSHGGRFTWGRVFSDGRGALNSQPERRSQFRDRRQKRAQA